jgi:hypothetical protein
MTDQCIWVLDRENHAFYTGCGEHHLASHALRPVDYKDRSCFYCWKPVAVYQHSAAEIGPGTNDPRHLRTEPFRFLRNNEWLDIATGEIKDLSLGEA